MEPAGAADGEAAVGGDGEAAGEGLGVAALGELTALGVGACATGVEELPQAASISRTPTRAECLRNLIAVIDEAPHHPTGGACRIQPWPFVI